MNRLRLRCALPDGSRWLRLRVTYPLVEGEVKTPMTPQTYSRLAALIFAIVALLQLARAVSGWSITVDTNISVPIWASWIACIVAAGLAWLGFAASRS